VILSALDPADYLVGDDLIDIADVGAVGLAASLRAEAPADTDFARAAFTWVRDWVRDRVAHSLDVQDPRITVSAVEVLVRPDAGVGEVS
jgi:hypothetical protein